MTGGSWRWQPESRLSRVARQKVLKAKIRLIGWSLISIVVCALILLVVVYASGVPL